MVDLSAIASNGELIEWTSCSVCLNNFQDTIVLEYKQTIV